MIPRSTIMMKGMAIMVVIMMSRRMRGMMMEGSTISMMSGSMRSSIREGARNRGGEAIRGRGRGRVCGDEAVEG